MQSLETAWSHITEVFEATKLDAERAARSQTSNLLNQIARRLKQYESEEDWANAVLDGAAHFAPEVGLFSVEAGALCVKGTRGIEIAAGTQFVASDGAAFAGAIQSKDTVVALQTPGEVTSRLSSDVKGQLAQVIPILNGDRVAALLFAASPDQVVDLNALELIVNIASSVLRQSRPDQVQISITPPAQPTPTKKETGAKPVSARSLVSSLPSWASLSQEERTFHIRAQRFARVKIAEMQLYKPESCRAGREQGNLYLYLKSEVETARSGFRDQFMKTKSMVDYLHLELVSTLADNDERKLGAEYPGQMV